MPRKKTVSNDASLHKKIETTFFLPFIWQVDSFLLYLQAKKKAYCMTNDPKRLMGK